MYQSKFHLTNLKSWSLKQNCSKHLSLKKKKTMVVRFVVLTKLPKYSLRNKEKLSIIIFKLYS